MRVSIDLILCGWRAKLFPRFCFYFSKDFMPTIETVLNENLPPLKRRLTSRLQSDSYGTLGAGERRALAAIADRVTLRSKPLFVQTGEPGDALYVVESGAIELSVTDNAGQKIVLKTAGCGDFFGEISLLDGKPRTATAAVLSDCELLRVSRENLLDVFRRHPEIGLRMLSEIGKQLRETDKLLRSNVARNVNEMMEKTMSPIERATDWVAWFSGSLIFVALTAVWFTVWIAVNTLPLGISAIRPVSFRAFDDDRLLGSDFSFVFCFNKPESPGGKRPHSLGHRIRCQHQSRNGNRSTARKNRPDERTGA